MTTLVITGGKVLTPLEVRFTNVWLSGGMVEALSDRVPDGNCEHLDASGCLVTPGLFDLQVNGGPTCNLWDGPSPESVHDLRQQLAMSGVTSCAAWHR